MAVKVGSILTTVASRLMVISLNFGNFGRLTCLVSVIAWGVLRASAQELATSTAAEEPAAQTEPAKPQPGTADKPPAEQPAINELEQLLTRPVQVPALQQVVNTVSRQESTVGKSPAAVFVITNEMIRRNGATSIPEALRMAPGVNVARIDANKWAVSIRGFNDRFAQKLLVQIDGRVVYNQLTGGVYWDVPDVVLQDVERIEVIRGPGATVWGSNAVNGIINIITKNSKDTQGLLVAAGGGSEDKGITSIRYGGHHEDDLHYRVYGKWFERDNSTLPSGSSQLSPPPGATPYSTAKDDWRAGRGGFRVDWNATSDDTVMLQGDAFAVSSARGDFRPQVTDPFVFQNNEDELSIGGDVLARWQHEVGENSSWALQLYWDHFGRKSANNNNVSATKLDNVDILNFRADTYDLDFQQQFPLGDRNKFIYGAGFRAVDTFFAGSVGDDSFAVGSAPKNRVLYRYAAFLQDELTLVDDQLFFTAGSKFEHNTFAGFQYQPSGRLLWTPTNRQSAWAAVSRAVRVPNILENALSVTGVPSPALPLGTFVQTRGNKNLNAEDVMAYELGYRAQPTDEFSFDTAVFYNVYNNLIGTRRGEKEPGPALGTFIIPANRANVLNAETYGVDLSANWMVSETWRLQTTYSFLQIQAHRASKISPTTERSIEGQSPQNQVYLQSSWDLTKEWQFDLMGRYVDHLSNFPSGKPNGVPSYISMDARLGWRPNQSWELSVVGQNLLAPHHLEFGGNQLLSAPLIELQRGVYAMAVWRH